MLADRWLTPEGMAAIPHLAADLAPLLEKKKVSHRKKETVPKDPEHQADPDAEPEEQPPPKKYTQRTKVYIILTDSYSLFSG